MKRIIRPKYVFPMVGLSRSTVFRLEREGKFPSKVYLSSARTSGYFLHEIEEWLANRPTEAPTEGKS